MDSNLVDESEQIYYVASFTARQSPLEAPVATRLLKYYTSRRRGTTAELEVTHEVTVC